MPELIVIFVIALIVFGPRRLPDVGRSLGRALAEFKRATNDFQQSLEDEIRAEHVPASTTAPGEGETGKTEAPSSEKRPA